jgi:hypothetical protein
MGLLFDTYLYINVSASFSKSFFSKVSHFPLQLWGLLFDAYLYIN